VHEPFWSALLGTLNDRERERGNCIISHHCPRLDFNAPALLLAIMDDPWLVILDEGSEPYGAHATFDDSLLAELTVILLYGKRRLDFPKGEHRSQLLCHSIIEQDHFDDLSLEFYAKHGGNNLDVIIPSGRQEEVEALMASCLNGKAKAASAAQLATGEWKSL
jgi:hypothetical protein